MLPEIVDEFKMPEWDLVLNNHPCFLYDFKSIGVTKKQFGCLIFGQPAILLETKLKENSIKLRSCPWCKFRSKEQIRGTVKSNWPIARVDNHVAEHNKTFVDAKFCRFQLDMYAMKLVLVRRGYYEAISFLVNNSCQLCVNPVVEEREGKCALPESARNKIRSLEVLGLDVEYFKGKRKYEWSMLGVIVLRKKRG